MKQIIRLALVLGLVAFLGSCEPASNTAPAPVAPPATSPAPAPLLAPAPTSAAPATPSPPAPATQTALVAPPAATPPSSPTPEPASPVPATATAPAASVPSAPVPAALVEKQKAAAPAASDDRVVITTERGKIVIELFEEDAPKHAENFKKLAREGFYNGLTFHRVIEGFMAQGGDPQGTGAVVPGYTIPAEIKRPHLRGSVAAARRTLDNPNRESSGSQFYIYFTAQPKLDGEYTVFGQVVEGMDVVDKLKRGTGANGAMIPQGSGDKLLKVEVVPR